MITGTTGSGKTALINGLYGRKVGEEVYSLSRGTNHVEALQVSFGGMVAIIWDTPGLQDGTGEEDRYLDEMKKHCSNCNLYIYCISMSQRRLGANEWRAMRELTDTFGKDWWKKVMFVLTFANLSMRLCPREHDLRECFQRNLKWWHDELVRKLVESCAVEHKVAEKIVVVPAAYAMPMKGNLDPWSLPGISNWLQNFWYKCAEVIDDQGFHAFVHLVINSRRCSVQDHITSAGLARAGDAASSRKSFSLSDFLPSLADVAAGDAIDNFYIDPTAISLYWKYSKRFPFATGEL